MMINIPTYPNVPYVNAFEELFPPRLPLTTLRVILFLYSPIASVAGTPSLWYAIPLTQSRVPLAGVIVIIIDIIAQIVSLCSHRRLFSPPPGFGMPDSINMSLSDLTELLTKLKNKSKEPVKANETSQLMAGGTTPMVAPESFTIFLFVTGFFGTDPESPRSSFYVPIINVKGLTGGLPMIILGLISTILIRQVVSPEASGVQPMPEPKEEPKFELKLPEILHLLKRFGGNFQ